MSCLLLNRGVLPNDTPTSATFVPASRHAAIRSLAGRACSVMSLACMVWLTLISSLGAVEFTARENTVTGTTSDGSPTVLINVKGEETLPGCEREYLTAVTYPTNPPPPGTKGDFTQAVRYFPGRNTITVTSATAKQIRTTTFTIAAPNLRVVMEWKADDLDYDLYVNEVNWTNKVTAEGRLDRDAFAGKEGPGKEEINFKSAKPGSYAIYANYYSDHGNGGSSPTKITVYLGNEIIFSQTQTITEFEGHGGNLAGTGKSVWNVGTVIIHGEKAGGYRVVDDNWAPSTYGQRDILMGDMNKPIVILNGQMAVKPVTDYQVTTLAGPDGLDPVVIGNGASTQITAIGQVNSGSSNEETRALIGKFKSSDSTVATIDELGVVTGLSVGKTNISFENGSSSSSSSSSRSIEVRVVDFFAVVDRSGDHKMLVDNNKTNHLKPFRLWLNDDHDIPNALNEDPVYGDMVEQSDKDDSTKDNADKSIKCRRDLEDFAPLTLTLSKKESLANVQDAVIEARWGTGTTGAPSIQVFRSTDDTGKLGYMGDYQGLSLRQTAESGGDARYSTALGVIDNNTWKSLGTIAGLKPTTSSTDVDQILPFIFEAVSAGQGWLELRVRTSKNAILGLKRVYVHLSPLTEWYAHYSTDPTGDSDYDQGRGAIPGNVRFVRAAAPWVMNATEAHTAVFVHGFNMPKWFKKMFAETAYKRMWWNGYRGRFVQFDWPTPFDITQLNSPATKGDPWYNPTSPSVNGYGRSEFISFIAGDRLAGLITSLRNDAASNGPLHLIAHSHGNVATANALNQIPAGSVATYIALQAAVRSELYGNPSAVMVMPTWLKGLTVSDNNPLVIDPQYTWNGSWWNVLGIIYPAADWISIGAGKGLETPNLAQGFLATKTGLGGASKQVNFYNPNDWALGEYLWEWAAINNPSMRMAQDNRRDEHYFYQRQITKPPQLPVPRGPFGAPDFDTNQSQRLGRINWLSSDTTERISTSEENILKNWITTPLPWTNGANGLRRSDDVWVQTGQEWRVKTNDSRSGSDGGRHSTWNVYPVVAPTETNQTLRQYEIIASVIESRRRAQGRSVMNNVSGNIDIRVDLWNNYADDSKDPNPLDERNGTDKNNRHFRHHRYHSGEFNGTIMEQSKFWREVLIQTSTTTQSALDIKKLTAGTP